jgi:hypothetical protein
MYCMYSTYTRRDKFLLVGLTDTAFSYWLRLMLQVTDSHDTALHLACRKGNMDIVRQAVFTLYS